MIDVKIIRKPKKGTSTVSGSPSAAGGGIISPSGSNVKEANHAKEADFATLAEHANRATLADRALEADHAALAADLDPDSPVNDRFLHKDRADRTFATVDIFFAEYFGGDGKRCNFVLDLPAVCRRLMK